jgi:hypothetical protein
MEIACVHLVDDPSRLRQLRRQIFHAHATELVSVQLDAAGRAVGPSQVVEAIAARPRDPEPLLLAAVPERTDRGWPPPLLRRAVVPRRNPAVFGVALERGALSLVELLAGGLERARQPIELSRRRVAQAAVEQRRGDEDRRDQRQQRGRKKRGDQAVAQSIHRGGRTPPPGGSRNGPPSRGRATGSALRRRLRTSISRCSVKPSSSAGAPSPSSMRHSTRIQNRCVSTPLSDPIGTAI